MVARTTPLRPGRASRVRSRASLSIRLPAVLFRLPLRCLACAGTAAGGLARGMLSDVMNTACAAPAVWAVWAVGSSEANTLGRFLCVT